MSAPILLTKLFIPENRPELVSRSHLVDQLNQGLHRKLSLISAPAGFGKTTVVTNWLHSQEGDDASSSFFMAWLSLDEEDNDPVRFLTYLVSALNRIPGLETEIGNGALQLVQAPQPPPLPTILTAVINDIAMISDKIVMVLDDYHLIDSQPVHDALIFLLKNLPPQLHLVITTREDPPIQISRLRTRGQLNEFRAVHLRFSTAEIDEFMNQIMGLGLSTQDISALEKRTEGWVAGLQLAAISMRGQTDISNFIQSFTGSHHFVIDYLVEEVLKHQPEDIRNFLLQTSILIRLTGSLCDALTGQENGHATLEALERGNLFIIPLDSERQWYRYHHLFADLLKKRLSSTQPDLVDDLHSKAVVWYETNGDLSEAIYHALAARNTKTATRLIEKGALEALNRSDLSFILKWVDQLPDSTLEHSPWLFIYHSWALLISGQVGGFSLKLENMDWLLDSIPDDDESQKREMIGYIAGLKALFCNWQRDYEKATELAHQAMKCLSEDNWIRGYCALVLGTSFWGSGNLRAAKKAFAESYSIGTKSGNKLVEVSGACNVAYSVELGGNLQQALIRFKDIFKLTKQGENELPVAGLLHIEIARVFYELDELELTREHLLHGIRLCKMLGRAEKVGFGLLARCQLASGELSEAIISIQNADKANLINPETAFDMRGSEFPIVRLWIKEMKLKEIEAWIKENGEILNNISYFKNRITQSMHARALIALGREYSNSTYIQEALMLIGKLIEMTEKNGWMSKVIELLALQSLAHQVDGDISKAMKSLEKALTLAEPEGFIRTFVDEGPPMARLLYEALSREISSEYVQKLLAAFPNVEPEKNLMSKPVDSDSEWIEPLSERELEVLQLIAEGLPRQEIASQLVLSLNTVKTHARNIYSKLGVSNQMQAVGKARGLGLLDKD